VLYTFNTGLKGLWFGTLTAVQTVLSAVYTFNPLEE